MSSRSTEQQREIDVQRFIFGLYARSFSSPRIQKLADAITDLDRLAATGVAREIDNAIGADASQKLLETISSHSNRCRERVTRRKKAASLGD